MKDSYRFRSRWTAPAAAAAVWDATERLLDAPDPFPWWPSVHVVGGDGSSLHLEARSVFGYVLRFRVYDLEREPPGRLRFASEGDLAGRSALLISPIDARSCRLDIDWEVRVNRAWMRASSWVLRPLFVLGHHALMRQGEKHFNRWLRGTQRT